MTPAQHSEMRAETAQIGYLQQLIARGEYQVSSARIAAAMLQRIGAVTLDREISGPDDRARGRERDSPRAG